MHPGVRHGAHCFVVLCVCGPSAGSIYPRGGQVGSVPRSCVRPGEKGLIALRTLRHLSVDVVLAGDWLCLQHKERVLQAQGEQVLSAMGVCGGQCHRAGALVDGRIHPVFGDSLLDIRTDEIGVPVFRLPPDHLVLLKFAGRVVQAAGVRHAQHGPRQRPGCAGFASSHADEWVHDHQDVHSRLPDLGVLRPQPAFLRRTRAGHQRAHPGAMGSGWVHGT
mmetsp:Transcript_6886/g.19035  ORF Transcript_6886/g.19035 Transcript_6886/m.19035 type:complete len:220 (-) Transcript_6886:2731-3390(-)